ncbi:uncharacterized protein A4U43_C06F7830 [Asparagus officinalis]|uniref:Uncharacterized protein n=1 Tax=Asparagus officinalis TaxID=4686 RepID=A0A5P1EKA0_ASPOF|nr:uncharacterized protein A4U43_C06F7830 [Asparagus officinalis]
MQLQSTKHSAPQLHYSLTSTGCTLQYYSCNSSALPTSCRHATPAQHTTLIVSSSHTAPPIHSSSPTIAPPQHTGSSTSDSSTGDTFCLTISIPSRSSLLNQDNTHTPPPFHTTATASELAFRLHNNTTLLPPTPPHATATELALPTRKTIPTILPHHTATVVSESKRPPEAPPVAGIPIPTRPGLEEPLRLPHSVTILSLLHQWLTIDAIHYSNKKEYAS